MKIALPLMIGARPSFFETCHLDDVEKYGTQCVGDFCNETNKRQIQLIGLAVVFNILFMTHQLVLVLTPYGRSILGFIVEFEWEKSELRRQFFIALTSMLVSRRLNRFIQSSAETFTCLTDGLAYLFI